MKEKLFAFWILIFLLVFQGCSSSIDEAGDDIGYPLQEALVPSTDEEDEQQAVESRVDAFPITKTELTVVDQQNPAIKPLIDFYQWYFEQPTGEVFRNRSYESQPQLSEIFKSDLGYLLDSFETTAGYDPFICAQQILPSITFDPVFVSGGEAYVLGQVQIEGEIRHYLVVQLGKGDGDWKIDAIRCPFEPMAAAIAFFTA